MLDKQKTKPAFIGFAGNIGVGKTTFTKVLSKRLKYEPFFEPVSDNPYLKDFYNDMNRWSFNLQVYFLHKRFEAHQKISTCTTGVIQDRTIYEDKEIFARNLYHLGKLSLRDWDNYCGLFKVTTSYLNKPDLIIYLKANTDTLISRISKRGRDYENLITLDYIHTLNIAYDRWIESISNQSVMIIETDNFNIFKNKRALNRIEKNIVKRLF